MLDVLLELSAQVDAPAADVEAGRAFPVPPAAPAPPSSRVASITAKPQSGRRIGQSTRSSTGSQLPSGSYWVNAPAIFSVSVPRSFSNTRSRWLTTKVLMPELP